MENKKSIFTRESLDHVSSPEKLDDYVRIASPGIWIMIAALLITVAAVIFWGVTGSLPESFTVSGVVDASNDNCVICLADASAYNSEDLLDRSVTISLGNGGSVNGTVVQTSTNPVSAGELAEALDDEWMSSKLLTSDYAYLVMIQPEEDLSAYSSKVLDVTVITGEVKPISFLLG